MAFIDRTDTVKPKPEPKAARERSRIIPIVCFAAALPLLAWLFSDLNLASDVAQGSRLEALEGEKAGTPEEVAKTFVRDEEDKAVMSRLQPAPGGGMQFRDDSEPADGDK